jgi:hypothetical protein
MGASIHNLLEYSNRHLTGGTWESHKNPSEDIASDEILTSS